VQPRLVYDGKTWLTAFLNTAPSETYGSLYINRGSSANSPYQLIPSTSTKRHVDASIVMVNGALAVAFTNSQDSVGPYGFSLQRFAIPNTTSSALSPIDNPVDVLATPTIAQRGDMQIAATGKYSMLAVWADNRWGANRELYARPIDLHSCP